MKFENINALKSWFIATSMSEITILPRPILVHITMVPLGIRFDVELQSPSSEILSNVFFKFKLSMARSLTLAQLIFPFQ